VRIPKDLEFPESVKEVIIRQVGRALHLSPEDTLWLDYFDEPAWRTSRVARRKANMRFGIVR
jgi:virulence-associated protein VagC